MEHLADWTHDTADIPQRGLERQRAVDQPERAAIARDLGLQALEKLSASYRITSIAGGGWRVAGTIDADVVQSCVVTLAPVPAHIAESFDVEFWEASDRPPAEGELAVLEGADIEPLENGVIAVGRIVRETLSAALDPYPRAEGAEFEWTDPALADPLKTSPFAVLGKLKGNT
ncbi:MAG: YceD family protein [Hyphomicrobium sp.]